jgi:alcohol dehydrogenase (cytochrome c)
MEACAIFTAKPEPFQEGQLWYAGADRRVPGETSGAAILAFNMDTLDYSWRDTLIGGNWSWAGVMSTATGLVAYGDDDGNFVIVDGRTDNLLWHFSTGQTINSSPMSYAVNGKQYFAIASGAGDVFTFGLP